MKESMMKSLRKLETNTKLFASFAILFCIGAGIAAWLLLELGQVADLGLGARASQKAAAALAEQVRAQTSTVRVLGFAFLGADLGVAIVLCLWLAAEVTRPVHDAVQAARRIAEGDLRVRADARAGGEPGLLSRTMQEMAEKLVGMISSVRMGTELIASASSDIATTSMDLSARTEQQAASLEETASSMEELTTTVKQNADHAHQASKLAISASEVAVKGGEVVSEVVGTMASINDSSKRIAEIIGVIDGIAFQTNILALNAAVEAARAGEQGRGFAVVASEVRSLAQRSAAAAKEIKALIDDSVEKVNAGTLLADKAGNTMNEVVTSVKRVTDIIAEIADASAEQTAGIEQVNQAIAAMDQATQQNAALVEESAAAAASMREQASGLIRVIGAFSTGTEQGKPAAPVQMIAGKAAAAKPVSQARARAAAPAGQAARPAPEAAPASPRRPATRVAAAGGKRAAAPDVDWEEF
jgi:methyl-accepting chemotaxis protein